MAKIGKGDGMKDAGQQRLKQLTAEDALDRLKQAFGLMLLKSSLDRMA
jgi:hypothetical protein